MNLYNSLPNHSHPFAFLLPPTTSQRETPKPPNDVHRASPLCSFLVTTKLSHQEHTLHQPHSLSIPTNLGSKGASSASVSASLVRIAVQVFAIVVCIFIWFFIWFLNHRRPRRGEHLVYSRGKRSGECCFGRCRSVR